MALNIVSSERLSTNVKTSNLGTELKKKVGQSKNLIINGAMQVAQRGTSSTTNGYKTVDRITPYTDNIGVTPTYSQVDVTSGGAYDAGFRKAWQVTKGAGTANTNSQVNMGYKIEAQDIANSGWKYTDPNSYITISFWLKTSVSNHNPQLLVQNADHSGTATKNYFVDIPVLTADTWTKITHSIPGHANQVYNNDNGNGLEFQIIPWYGTDYTDAGNTPNAWGPFGTKPVNTTWLTTNSSTFQVTGMQLETGSVATDFEHRSFADEIIRCERYYRRDAAAGVAHYRFAQGQCTSSTGTQYVIKFPVRMRAAPTYATSGTLTAYTVNSQKSTSSHALIDHNTQGGILSCTASGLSAGNCVDLIASNDGNAYIEFIAEL